MNGVVKRRLEMAARVLAYAREHPSDVAGYQAAVATLVERLARADATAQAQTTQGLLGKGAVAERLELRRGLTADLQLLAAVARMAGMEAVGVPVIIRYPGPRQSNIQFLDGGRAALELGREHEALLVRRGLPEQHLDELDAGFQAFAALLNRRDDAAVARIGARSELSQLGRELSRVADQIGAFLRHQYRNDPAALVAWEFARATHGRKKKVAAQPANGSAPQAPPLGAGDPGTAQ
jgi:hypothetical protein